MNSSENQSILQYPNGWVKLVILVFLALVIIAQRVFTYSEPLDRDIAGYALIGHEWIHGRLLYTDLWERKPPLLFAIFAAAERLVGYGASEIFFLNITAALATLLGVYTAGRSAGSAGGLFAAGLWAILCADLPTQANQPNAEVFVNAFLTAGFAILVRWPPRRSYAASIALGVLFTAATLFKQHVVVTCAALTVAHFFIRRHAMRDRFVELAIVAGIGVIAWTSILGHFAAVGRLGDVVDALLLQNLTYAGSLGGDLIDALKPNLLFPSIMVWAIGPAALVLTWMVYATRRPVDGHTQSHRVVWILWSVWMLSTVLSVAIPGHFYFHYYQLWIPPWCIAGGWAAAGLVSRDLPFPRKLRTGIVVVVMLGLFCRQAFYYRLSPAQWAYTKDPENTFEEDDRLGRALSHLLASDETFYNLGEENTIYFAARKSPPSGLLYLEPLVTGDETAKYWRRLMVDLNRRPPDLVVVSKRWLRCIKKDSPIRQWLREYYRPADTDLNCPDYYLLVRRDSPLRLRLENIKTNTVAF